MDRGENSINLLSLADMFNTLVHFGATKQILRKEEGGFSPFYHDRRGAICHGAIALVSKDLAIDNNHKELSNVFTHYKYQTFDRSKDTPDSIRNKVNTFIKTIFRDSEGNADAIPKFNVCVCPLSTNLVLVSFFNIQLPWQYNNVSGSSIKFHSNKDDSEGKTVEGFCIQEVKQCAAAIFDDEYLVLRLPVNWISGDALYEPEEKKKDPSFTEPWRKDPDGGSRLEEIIGNFVYLTLVTKVSRPEEDNTLANTEFDQSSQNCAKMEKK